MNEFYIEIEVGDASPLSFFSSFLSSFLTVAYFSKVELSPALPDFPVIVRPLFIVILFYGDGDSSSTLVGDLYS